MPAKPRRPSIVDHDAGIAAERRAAARLLLAEALVRKDGPHADVFPLIRRHADWLADMFRRFLEYDLIVEAGFARLFKAGPGVGAGRGLARATGTPFSPRTYAYLALSLAVLVTAPEQMLLSVLVADVRAAAADADIELDDVGRRSELRTLTAALRQLVVWGVLTETEGSVAAYAERDDGEALLTVDRDLARNLLNGPFPDADDAEDLIARAADPGRDRQRIPVRRRLAETPVVIRDELTPEEDDWLRRNQRREAQLFQERFGLEAEIRAEGVAMLDPAEELSDIRFPGTGTVAQAGLLLIGRLLAEARPTGDDPAFTVSDDLLSRHLGDLVDEYARVAGWQKDLVAQPHSLRAEVVDLLIRMRVMRRTPEKGLELLAVAGRYAAHERRTTKLLRRSSVGRPGGVQEELDL
ncbi:TIGR02678 family protein [Yinghuangia seranimata]|uniref:TIGR02678 family protein n=1 Tax=Yinghuangia seranimata TaxID=408067 RepID=UPI00248C16D6|nr:TIGR02678 family protein [Yinghuangia seranimata]MDI2125100.1 TIGR02678 family protein [Yinghuangia seranimata]